MNQGNHAKTKPSFLGRICAMLATVAIAFLATSFSNEFLIQAYAVPSGSMEPTISTGERVIAEQISYYFRDVKPGDIIVFEDPENSNRNLLKRCIAVGGQTIDLQNGVTYIDGIALSEPYIYGKPTEPSTRSIAIINYPYTIPDDSIWVMGDNRTNSKDSRYFGPIATSAIKKRVFFTSWPLNNLGSVS